MNFDQFLEQETLYSKALYKEQNWINFSLSFLDCVETGIKLLIFRVFTSPRKGILREVTRTGILLFGPTVSYCPLY